MSAAEIVWVAADPASQRVLEIAGKLAETATTLLITGESGTGKDQLARWIHEHGPRRDAPFLKIDCASLPAELVESELFGHERGAFTGAVARKPGRLEMALGGTVILDEVAALSSVMQAKLLRVLEERTFERLGGTETLRMEARVMALTNTDLDEAVAAGPLSRRPCFSASTCWRFRCRRCASAAPTLPLSPRIFSRGSGPCTGVPTQRSILRRWRCSKSYAWPGNVRELKNAIEHALVFAKEPVLRAEDFPEILRAARMRAVPGLRCARLKISSAKPSARRSRRRTTRSARPPIRSASAARRCSKSARNTA